MAGRPFFIVMAWALLISLLDRHFTQYASKAFLQICSSKVYPTLRADVSQQLVLVWCNQG